MVDVPLTPLAVGLYVGPAFQAHPGDDAPEDVAPQAGRPLIVSPASACGSLPALSA